MPTIDVFIDSNIFLNFYEFSGESVRVLESALSLDHLRLWLTEQVRDEVERKRDETIAKALKAFRQGGDGNVVPPLVRDHPKFSQFELARTAYTEQKNQLT